MGDCHRFTVSRLAPGVSESPDLSKPYPVGGGSFASVWRAGTRREYAIKSFYYAGEDEARLEFDYLVKLNKAGCKYVPKVFCLGTFVDGTGKAHDAFVEEYVDGDPLAEVLSSGVLAGNARVHTVSVSQAVAVTLEAARALKSIAENGLAHRDFSPKNIMLTKRCIDGALGEGVDLYLLDFGQSTLIDRGTVTQVAPRLATIPYGAPEVFGGDYYEERNSEKCDTWSLGALICTLVAGEYWPPEIADLRDPRRIQAGMTEGDMRRVVDAKLKPIDLLSLLKPAVGVAGFAEQRLADIVSGCTNYDPEYRPQISKVIKRLEGLLKSMGGTVPETVTPTVGPDKPSMIDVSERTPPMPSPTNMSPGKLYRRAVLHIIDGEFESAVTLLESGASSYVPSALLLAHLYYTGTVSIPSNLSKARKLWDDVDYHLPTARWKQIGADYDIARFYSEALAYFLAYGEKALDAESMFSASKMWVKKGCLTHALTALRLSARMGSVKAETYLNQLSTYNADEVRRHAYRDEAPV